ncbi:hypothetical protein DFP72DRAFT_816324, partial [Ephemerocybe angulata]
LHRILFAIVRSSTLLLPKWYVLLEQHAMPKHVMLHDVVTRWNSTYDMCQFALDHREIIDIIAAYKASGLRDFELGEEEWVVVKELCDVQKVFKDATMFFSRGTPNLANVIPAMDQVDQILTSNSLNDATFSAPIRAACALAKKTLNCYYDKTDHL